MHNIRVYFCVILIKTTVRILHLVGSTEPIHWNIGYSIRIQAMENHESYVFEAWVSSGALQYSTQRVLNDL
jgi:hypothetical protein